MVNVDEAVIARLTREGSHFEILVDCDKALEFREGKSVSLSDVVAVDDIFSDVKKGLKASESEIKKVFGTVELEKIFERIIKKGEVQLTSKHLAKIRDEKRKKIVNIIHRNAIDSQSGMPHPAVRIENAMEEAKVRIDERKSAEEQVPEILKKLQVIIPIKFEKRELEVKIPPKYAAKSMYLLKKYHMKTSEWMNDGSLLAVVEIPAGIQDEFFSELNGLTHGEVESKILRTV
jgi:ribosome maturation protein SDO1